MSIYEGLSEGDFAKSTKKRLPICFCLDASGSMDAPTESGKTRMEELRAAFNQFIDAMKANEDVAASADIAVVKFGGKAEIVQGFQPLKDFKIPDLKTNYRSLTPIGQAILIALQLLEIRKGAYKEKGMKYFQPWLVVLTDGEPEGDNAIEEMNQAIEQTVALESENKLVVFNIGIGSEVDTDTLGRLSVKRKAPISVGETDLKELFAFLGSSSESIISGGNADNVLYQNLPVGEEFKVDEFNNSTKCVETTVVEMDIDATEESAEEDIDISEWCI